MSEKLPAITIEIDFGQVLRELSDEPMKNWIAEGCSDNKCSGHVVKQDGFVTLGKACLMFVYAGFEDLNGSEKVERTELARIIYRDNLQKVTTKQIELIRQLASEKKHRVHPLVVTQILEMTASGDK